jgi:hypothetical protein
MHPRNPYERPLDFGVLAGAHPMLRPQWDSLACYQFNIIDCILV